MSDPVSISQPCPVLLSPHQRFISFEKLIHSIASTLSPPASSTKGTFVLFLFILTMVVSSMYYSDEDWHLEVVWKRGSEKQKQNKMCFFLAKVRLVFLPLCAWIQTEAFLPLSPPPFFFYFCWQKATVSGAARSRPLFFSLRGTAEGVMWCRTCQCNMREMHRASHPSGREPAEALRRLHPVGWGLKICTCLKTENKIWDQHQI